MYEAIEKAIAEIQQPRSKFQLEKFVVGSHPTPEMQYYQTCLEMQDLIHKYKFAKISVKKQEIKIARLRTANDDLKELKAQEIEIGLEQTKLAMIGAERELQHLVEIFNTFEIQFTREQIELAQSEYWEKRLTQNAKAMLMGGSGVNPAHIEAMEQAGALNSFIEQVQLSKKELGL
tara:strand:- start:6 stop:533 length:528 start_codon:yes stop_codon:yes gene_type:complete